MLRRILSGITIVFFLCLLPATTARPEQDDGLPQIVTVLAVTVKPGKSAQYEEVVQKIVAANRKMKTPIRWVAHRTYTGETLPQYVYISSHPNWAEMDEWFAQGGALAEVLGEEEAVKLIHKLKASTIKVERSILIPIKGLSLR